MELLFYTSAIIIVIIVLNIIKHNKKVKKQQINNESIDVTQYTTEELHPNVETEELLDRSFILEKNIIVINSDTIIY